MTRRRVPVFKPKTVQERRELQADIRLAKRARVSMARSKYLILMQDARCL